MIRVKRVYEPPEPGDGTRLLVDRLWPRGLKKEQLLLDGWHRDVAPSNELRQWYHHAPGRWEEFKRRYFAELDQKPQTWESLMKAAREENITLVYAAQNREHNNAVALKAYLEARLQK